VSNDKDVVAQWDETKLPSMEEFVKRMIKSMFDSDNDTSYIEVELGEDDARSLVSFKMQIVAINGVNTGADDNG
jgi:hypothetical protein